MQMRSSIHGLTKELDDTSSDLCVSAQTGDDTNKDAIY